MSCDIQVVELGETNSLVPNLTISVDNETDEKDVPEIEYDQKLLEEKESLNSNTQVTRKLNSFPRKRIYENKIYGTAANLGLSFEEAETRRKKRAQRFQSPLIVENDDEKQETPEELLHKSKVFSEQITKANEKLSLDDDEYVRLEALHLIGVNSMSTSDIFAYFGSSSPHHIEWINDNSCNVVWNDSEICRITMERIAIPFSDSHKKKPAETKSFTSPMFDDDLDLTTDADAAHMDTEDIFGVNDEIQDIPFNPIRKCKEAFKNNKKSFLEVRYAIVGDRKEKFAAKRSNYYKQHGNPHYGGTKGILTSSYRRRYQIKKAMKEYRTIHPQHDDEENGKKLKLDDPEHDRMEKEDENLIKSTVKDLGENSSSSDDDGARFGTMMADRVSMKNKAVREMSERAESLGGLKVSKSNNRIQSRLGQKKSDNSLAKYALSRVEKRLRRNNHSTGMRSDGSVDHRKLQRYSPPPWE